MFFIPTYLPPLGSMQLILVEPVRTSRIEKGSLPLPITLGIQHIEDLAADPYGTAANGRPSSRGHGDGLQAMTTCKRQADSLHVDTKEQS